jgi:hypothetical protein
MVIVGPEVGYLRGRGFEGVGQLNGDFAAGCVSVVPVQHAAGYGIPGRAVGDTIGEGGAVPHRAVVDGVAAGDILEEQVVGRGRIDTSLAIVIVGIVYNQSAGVKVGGEDETILGGPVHNVGDLGLSAGITKGLTVEDIAGKVSGICRERAVQVVAVGVVSRAKLQAIRIHQGHDPDGRRVDEVGDARIRPVLGQEQVDEVKAHLGTQGFVAVHCSDVLELGFILFVIGVVGNEQRPELASLDGLTECVQVADGWICAGMALQFRGDRVVVVVLRH